MYKYNTEQYKKRKPFHLHLIIHDQRYVVSASEKFSPESSFYAVRERGLRDLINPVPLWAEF